MNINQDKNIASLYCTKCNNEICKRDFLCCEVCKQYYHLDCTDVSFQLFKIMKSKTFRCQPCINSPNYLSHSTPVSHHLADNVTQRKKPNVQCNLPINNSFELLSDHEEEDQEITSKMSTTYSYSSLPNVSITQRKNTSCPALQLNSDIIEDLKEKIRSLETKLEITENELENQLSENHILGKKILEYEHKVAKLSHICQSTHKSNCNSTRSKQKIYNKTRLDLSRTSTYQRKTRVETSFGPDHIEENRDKSLTSFQTFNNSPLHVNSDSEKKKTNALTTSPIKANICVLSSNGYNKTLSTLDDMLSEHFHIIHYLKTNCGIKELLHGIETKVVNYTYRDYCIVFIGDYDFTSSKDYFELTNYIKNALQKIQHTNVILCLPTYRLNKHIFNGRVESFSNMLYWDSVIHEYAYLLDTNLNLHYSRHMYRGHTGIIKTNALRIISKDLKRMILHIKKYHISLPCGNPNCNDDTFFRRDFLESPTYGKDAK